MINKKSQWSIQRSSSWATNYIEADSVLVKMDNSSVTLRSVSADTITFCNCHHDCRHHLSSNHPQNHCIPTVKMNE